MEKRERLEKEINNLMELVAAGTPARAIAPTIAEREAGIRDVDARLRCPRLPKLSTAKLRAALEQRAKEWKAQLRAEPQIARMVLRRLVGPIVLHDEGARPDFVRWEAEPKTELLAGLATPTLLVASPRGREEGRRWQPATFVVGFAA